jgi:LEA14-like dessication related protein
MRCCRQQRPVPVGAARRSVKRCRLGRVKLALIGVGIGMGVAAAGCATLVPRLEAPQLTVTGIALAGGSMQQQQIRLTLHATNPNPRDIAIRGIDCSLDLEGMPFAQGMTGTAFTLPALGAVDFDLDVTANLNNALVALAGALGRSTVDYHFYGHVYLPNGIVRTIPFDGTGHVRL